MSDLVKRLRKFANGCRGSMWQSRDETISLMDEAANRIEALTAERDALAEKLARAVEALEPYEALAKHHAADAPEWGPFDSVTAQVSILHLKNVPATLAAIKEGGA